MSDLPLDEQALRTAQDEFFDMTGANMSTLSLHRFVSTYLREAGFEVERSDARGWKPQPFAQQRLIGPWHPVSTGGE